MKPSLELKLNQQLTMTPQLQQAIKLLQLSSLELELEIQTNLEKNLLLEQVETEEESIPSDTPFSAAEEIQQIEHFEDLEHFTHSSIRTDWNTPHSVRKTEIILQKQVETTLKQHLLWQMELAPFTDQEKLIAIALIDAISEEGYLLSPLSEIQDSLETPVEILKIESVLIKIQQFDPIGVGARNLAECLTTQLSVLPHTTPWLKEAKLLITDHLETVGKRDYTRLKSTLKLSESALKSALKILTSLNPRPGNQISSKKCEYIIPDLIVMKKNGRLAVELNKEFIPELRVNANYIELLKRADPSNDLHMIKDQMKEAKWFIKSLKTRHETLLKVAKCILEQQKDFLDRGEEAMRPLNLQDVALAVGLHESTISRITTQKYILTPRGIFELKYFFSNTINSIDGKQDSATAIRALIKKLITEEPDLMPLSDHKITELLSERGINIARRTVNKYREALRIPSSNERKNLNF